jgi:ActR/RegA family two-component response regulator
MLKHDGKKFFLIASSDEAKKKRIKQWIEAGGPDSVIYTATDYMECLIKIKNAPPHVLITDYELGKGRPGQIVEALISDPASRVVILALGVEARSDRERDAIALGRLHFLSDLTSREDWISALQKMDQAFRTDAKHYALRTLRAGETLIREGEDSKQVYIVKKGRLRASRKGPGGKPELLGEIRDGEFVGEMAYFNEEARMATVEAVEDSEVVEIDPQVFEKVIYGRPSWAKTLFATLARRLKKK